MKSAFLILLPSMGAFTLGFFPESHLAHGVKMLLPLIAATAVLAILLRRWKDLGLSLVLCLGSLSLFSCHTLPQAEEAKQQGLPLRVFAANLYIGNTELDPLLQHLQKTQPDFIILTEFGFEQQAALAELHRSHPFGLRSPQNTPFGIAVFSRFPGRCQLLPDEDILPSIYADIQVEGRSLRLLASHPFPPLGDTGRERRDRQLRRLAELLPPGSASQPLIVAGDFNSVPWNAPLSDFAQRLNLRGTSGSYCHGGTFPIWAGPFGLTLDHILVSPEFRLKDFQRGPDIGSDHLPISAELEW